MGLISDRVSEISQSDQWDCVPMGKLARSPESVEMRGGHC